MAEIGPLGGDTFAHALDRFRAGEPVTYRGMTLVLRQAALDVHVPAPAEADVDPRRALDLLTRARYRLGALLASAPPLAAAVGNRATRLVLASPAAELYELRGDRLRSLGPP